jgi:PBP1b-binding outer membrane lipoprotein LpoB
MIAASCRAQIALAALLFAVAGCSDPAPEPTQEPAVTEPAAPATSQPAVTPTPVVIDTIPQALHGRWGMNLADCDRTRSDAKGAMEVGAGSLKFYESVAKLGRIDAISDRGIGATYNFTGEGQEWQLNVELALSPDGKTLTRKDRGPDALPDPLTYQRCEA